MQPIQGIHHITAFARDPQRNADFYHLVLGQRLLKQTVNFDDPGTYHLYYGDKIGTPGTILTFFPWPNAAAGVVGNGEVSAIAYTIAADAVNYWIERLKKFGVDVTQPQPRFGETVLKFTDPDGMQLELVAADQEATIELWRDGPIPPDKALLGFHGATLWVGSAPETAKLLTEQLGYRQVARDASRYRLHAAGDRAMVIDLLERPGERRGRMGAGSVHHIAFRTVDDSEQIEYLQQLQAAGYGVTDVRDRQYFRSIYFREPNGILFEVATDAPGFAIDEPVEKLGHTLQLPPWYEPQRNAIEKILPPLTYPQFAAESGER